jgi:hypothetical protein
MDDSTEHKLLSMMAFEQLHVERHANEVTAYVFFMDNVIKSEADHRRHLEWARQQQRRCGDVQPARQRGRARPLQPPPRRATRRQHVPHLMVARVACQPHLEPRQEPLGHHLPCRCVRPPRAHRVMQTVYTVLPYY